MRTLLKTMLAILALWLGTVGGAPARAASEEDGGVLPASTIATKVAEWVIASGDNDGLPFAIVDKVQAELIVFEADGRQVGVTPALLGQARGDDSSPGIGERALASIGPEERTTPAGRFHAGYGPATGGKDVLWVDYATAVSLHEVAMGNPKERRLQRLRSPTPEDNRITYGCINVSTVFYEDVVRPLFARSDGVIYVLPENKPLEDVLPAFGRWLVEASTTFDQTVGQAP